MLLYILLHVLFGLITGAALCYLLRPARGDAARRRWLACLACIGVILLLAAGIGRYPRHKVSEDIKLLGTGIAVVAFLIGFALMRRR